MSTWRVEVVRGCDADGWCRPSGGGHHARERRQSPGEGPEAVGARRPGRRPSGRSLAVRKQRRQTQEQVLVEKLQGWCLCVSLCVGLFHGSIQLPNHHLFIYFYFFTSPFTFTFVFLYLISFNFLI